MKDNLIKNQYEAKYLINTPFTLNQLVPLQFICFIWLYFSLQHVQWFKIRKKCTHICNYIFAHCNYLERWMNNCLHPNGNFHNNWTTNPCNKGGQQKVDIWVVMHLFYAPIWRNWNFHKILKNLYAIIMFTLTY